MDVHPAPGGYDGKRVTVMGLGSFGGGVGAARFLAQRGARVSVTDLRSPEQLRKSLDQLADLPIAAYRLGGHREEDFADADLVVVSPAVPKESPFLEIARRRGVPLSSEMNLFFQHCRAPIIGVTGSNGKSTTAAMIYALLVESGFARPAGGYGLRATDYRLQQGGALTAAPHCQECSGHLAGVSDPPPRPYPPRGEGVIVGRPLLASHPMSQAERVARSPKPVAAVPKPVARSLKPVAWLGGNIGGSLLPQVDDIQPQDLVVLELSSFQLEDLAALRRSPHVAVVISFTPNHLDRHGTLEAYRQAKLNILRFQGPDDLAVLNMDDAEVARWGEYTKARVLGFGLGEVGQGAVGSGQEQGSGVGGQGSGRSGQPTAGSRQWTLDNGQRASLSALRPRPSALDPPPSTPRSLLDALQLPGRHNRLNALAALTVVTALADIGFDDLRRALAEFRGLPHRLELVAEIAGRKFYNDSIATTPESTLVALASFDAPIILIAGGYDKGLDLTPVAREAARRAKAVAFIGQTAETLHTAMLPLVAAHHLSLITRHSISTQDSALSTLAIYRAPNLPDAVHWAWQQSQPGDVILLSPACASYDQFLNFEHRGEVFRQLVADLNRP